MSEQDDQYSEPSVGSSLQGSGWTGDFLRSLFDLEFRRLLTPRMLPTLFIFAIVASALAVITYVLNGFAESFGGGLVRLFLTGPLAFLVLVVVARVTLEFLLAIFRIAVHVNKMAGHTEEIASGLPRIQFWKPGRQKPDDDAY